MTKAQDKKFNETLQRMLKTPPTPHEKSVKNKAEEKKPSPRRKKVVTGSE